MHASMEENVLQMLYERYTELHPIDNETMKEGYQKLEEHLQFLSLEEKNAVFKIVCGICAENERLAFTQGVKAGVKLSKELTE